MRKQSAVAVLLLLFAVPAFAQDRTSELQKGRARLSVFGSSLGYTESDVAGSNWHGGYGLALEYALTERWSIEAAVSREDISSGYFAVLNPDGSLSPQHLTSHAHPIDVTAQYHFFTTSAWKPFLGVGLRYVESPDMPFLFPFEDSRSSVEVTGGVHYNFNRHFGLRLDGRQLLRGDDTWFDRGRKFAVGFGWKF